MQDGQIAIESENVPGPPSAEAGADAARQWERRIDTTIVVVLAIASLLAAWAGYQAGLWSAQQTHQITIAEDNQIDATRATTIGYQMIQIDVATFLNWLNAFKGGDEALADFMVERFSPQLATAFEAWMATDPLNSEDAPSDPFRMPEYQVPQLQEAAGFDEAVHLAIAEADRAGTTGDAYVLVALLLAVVLFFAGVCTKIGWKPAQIALLGLAVLLLGSSIWQLGALPDASPWGVSPLWDGMGWIGQAADPLAPVAGGMERSLVQLHDIA